MFPNRTTRRKRWNIQGPRGSLRWLRNELADYGCVESQYVLAKQLLEEPCELEADRLSNFKQALEWLICATEQGHEEGRDLLRSTEKIKNEIKCLGWTRALKHKVTHTNKIVPRQTKNIF